MADAPSNAAPHKAANEWTLWVLAASCALHPIEEYFTGWQRWASQTLGIVMPTALFVLMNAALLVAAVSFARIGWRRPMLSLIIPAATLVNAVFFHIHPTVVQHRVSPGVYTATLLYLPFSSWAFLGARRDGIPVRTVAAALGRHLSDAGRSPRCQILEWLASTVNRYEHPDGLMIHSF